jgi:hypothetical protein
MRSAWSPGFHKEFEVAEECDEEGMRCHGPCGARWRIHGLKDEARRGGYWRVVEQSAVTWPPALGSTAWLARPAKINGFPSSWAGCSERQ